METEPTPKKILIIEDDPYICDIYSRGLSSAGYSVSIANDGLEGNERVKKEKFNLVLLDIMLPKINGLDILKAMKENPETKAIPVVILTNLSQDQTVKDAQDLGAAAYITKADVTPEQVIKTVRQYISA